MIVIISKNSEVGVPVRKISTDRIKDNLYDILLEMNCTLSMDIQKCIHDSVQEEASPIGQNILQQIEKNIKIANEKKTPLCQDTGMVIVFLEIGQEVQFQGDYIEDALQEGIKCAYEEGYFRKSIVADPLNRVNTKDNTPGIIHYQIVKGDGVKMTVMAKGFGSENMSAIAMLKPSDGVQGIKTFIIDTVKAAGSNACPPLFIGVGIGGTFEKCALLAKKALARDTKEQHPQEKYAQLEKELLGNINALGIGPMGMGGKITALGLKIETCATHIAGLPVAVNICCHVNRHKTVVL
ncbi:MAG: fumarate hydratase [Eubacteriales bacterium]